MPLEPPEPLETARPVVATTALLFGSKLSRSDFDPNLPAIRSNPERNRLKLSRSLVRMLSLLTAKNIRPPERNTL